ncbi:phosphate transport system permease protein [Candidatus Xenohaliotis californiensis]|uniref:Phosphate transport system permease protein n=1 Tax=Candidatus Xenohaliotis californiensis TaxID=84677 RepID=A0ABP0ET73_9RICK|nr:phosphate transport system permease protein [Candidatus Xenohaliotis californiensis]
MFRVVKHNNGYYIWRKLISAGFISICFLALLSIILFVLFLLAEIFVSGADALLTRRIFVPVAKESQLLDTHIDYLQYKKIVYNGMNILFKESSYDKKSTQEIADSLVSDYSIREITSSNIVMHKGYSGVWLLVCRKMLVAEAPKLVKDALSYLKNRDLFKTSFNTKFFFGNDSAYPEAAGIAGSIVGTLLSILVAMAISIPIGMAVGIYFSEISADNKLNRFVFAVIVNLASVPTVVYGLLSFAMFISFLGIPRSTALLAGMTLALIAVPHVIITVIDAVQLVPKGIKHSALALGASRIQVVLHHSLPIASQRLVAGVLLSMARVIGETAPLVIIGMLVFTTERSWYLSDVSTTLPIRIYLWSKNPNGDYQNMASGTILVLVLILMLISILARILKYKSVMRN